VLLAEFAAHQSEVLYQPIDVSETALAQAAKSIAQHVPGVRVEPQVANYITDGYRIARPDGAIVLALYIGSSIGNFSPAEEAGILSNLRAHIEPGDALLLGVDLAPGPHKSVETLLAAYDDAAGVTASFNRNVLARLNRELGANFDLNAFAHRARWNATESRIEMHLESERAQTVTMEGARIHFEKGETIHTENSYKFTRSALDALLCGAGFETERVFEDKDNRFAVALARAV
jgi:L-histidine N-alpha-methyltransferase